MTGTKKARIIQPKADLKARAKQFLDFGEEAQERASQAMERFAERNAAWPGGQVAKLREIVGGVAEGRFDFKSGVEKLHEESHKLRGLAGNLGFPLLTKCAESLCTFIKGRELKPEHAPVMLLHVETMEAIRDQDLRDDGGETGSELLQDLKDSIAAVS